MIKRRLPILRLFCDANNRLTCLPYSRTNLHRAAKTVGIGKVHFIDGAHPHYYIPVPRRQYTRNVATMVTTKEFEHMIEASKAGALVLTS